MLLIRLSFTWGITTLIQTRVHNIDLSRKVCKRESSQRESSNFNRAGAT